MTSEKSDNDKEKTTHIYGSVEAPIRPGLKRKNSTRTEDKATNHSRGQK